jgi:cell division control protein 24
MSDPLSIAASVAGLISLANEIGKIIASYVSSVKSAPDDAERLRTELTALSFGLEQMRKFLLQEELDASFDDTSFLASVLGFTSACIKELYKKLSTLNPPRTESPGLLIASNGRYARKNVRRLWKKCAD